MDKRENEQNFLDAYIAGPSDPSFDLADNPHDRLLLSMLRDAREENLSPYAFRSKNSRGRRFQKRHAPFDLILKETRDESFIRKPFVDSDTRRKFFLIRKTIISALVLSMSFM